MQRSCVSLQVNWTFGEKRRESTKKEIRWKFDSSFLKLLCKGALLKTKIAGSSTFCEKFDRNFVNNIIVCTYILLRKSNCLYLFRGKCNIVDYFEKSGSTTVIN